MTPKAKAVIEELKKIRQKIISQKGYDGQTMASRQWIKTSANVKKALLTLATDKDPDIYHRQAWESLEQRDRDAICIVAKKLAVECAPIAQFGF